jgi:hypothetical protein
MNNHFIMKRFITVLIVLIAALSCRQTSEALYITKQCNGAGSFVIDTPAQGQTCYRVQANNDFLGFKQIANPSDTFFFRIQYGKKNTFNVFEYIACDSFQSFRLFAIPAEKRGQLLFDKEKDDIDNYVKVFDPTKKGKIFLKKMAENHILELPHTEQIKGYPDDEVFSNACIIEYSCKCRYKVQLYKSPRTHSSEFKEAKRLMNFVDYLSKEFGF